MIEFRLPLKTENPLNTRQHYRKVAKRGAHEKFVTLAVARAHITQPVTLPCVVVVTRISAGVLDRDALAASAKHIVDGVCAVIGVDDGEVDKVLVQYRQEPCKRGEYGVRVEVHEGMRLVETLQKVGT